MKVKITIIILLSLISSQLFAQELLPFVENYNKSDYKGDNQIWNVAQGNDDAMYFANNYYLLRYDGVKWEKYTLPNKTIIRSILVDGDRIYSGSYKEFGYWYRKKGKMLYVSLSDKTKVFEDSDNEEIWKIFKFKGKIYFQSFNGIFLYDGKVIKKEKFSFLISYCFVVDDQLLVASVENGIYKMNNSTFEKIQRWSILENNVIHAIGKFQNKTYIFTKKNGVYIDDKGVLSTWKNPLNTILKTANINAAAFIKNNKLVIGTASKGVYLFDLKTNSYKNINRNNVLMNNSILSMGLDKENDLWLGLDNGIAHVEVNSPISIFYDNSGVLGSVYSVATIDKGYLMASNHGIFKLEGNQFSIVPNTEGQAWNISKINNKYLIGHNEGTFVYEKGLFYKLSAVHGGWNVAKSSINNSYLQATYSGVIIYNDIDDLNQKKSIKGLVKPIKYVAQNRKNEIWAADNNRGLYRILYNDAYETTAIENVTQRSKISNDFGVKIFEFRNEILFLINKSWYTYNSITNQLEKDKLFNSNFKNISNIATIDENHFIVLQSGLLYHIYANANKFVWNVIQEKYYSGKIINDNLKIFKNKESYLLNLDDGFISLQLKQEKKQNTNIKIEAFSEDSLIHNKSRINYNSELKIHVISGKFGAAKPNLFYKTTNTSRFIPIKEGLIVLNNLSSGDHSVTIYGNDGLNYTTISNFQFIVAKPWYFSFWMISLYLIVISTILYLYYKWNKIRYVQKLEFRDEELKHQNKILEMELKAQNKLNIQEYEKHILELELQTKSSEVAGKSLSIAKQSEMIERIQGILDSESDFNKLKSDIKKVIKINALNKHEWETFENNLNQIHNEFIVKLAKKYPNLTSKDIKLCIYLKMNLSSKEIAPMMNISFRGVELQRYRLRKKLNLNQEENLSKFLLNI
ncbi:histidine kinase [Flavobacterium sp. GSP27]|uniref:helix-turn-helix and ligand-binding sensor domain-containing protein n=1 Tax=unclassified Flavobacterium TaxID=196869 RepID=UPI000F8319BF|nr:MULTISPECIES: histidine kinase [unclassified Flavobacterium]RTY84958.1 histidine kinase [Flavobacterium sp. ZB4P23]RTY94605.1 histidine kinase [Flavobacterium sp. GSN2]RTZ10454.1 histidine kinase [Flavobacterium sp. GSP27]